jgi:hypothetical protein
MKKILLFTLIIASCNSSKRTGKVIYGEGGKIESGYSKIGCTPPTKRYTKDLDARVKASIDSLLPIPIKDIDLGLTQKITRLSDYTSQGLDFDLIMFRICEMANNRGFSAGRTDSLIQNAFKIWEKNKTSSLNIINNYGINNGIIASTINVLETNINDSLIKDNFEFIQHKEPYSFLPSGFSAIETKPKYGTWQTPFYGYPIEEDSLVNGKIRTKIPGLQQFTSNIADIYKKDTKYVLKVYYTSQSIATNKNGLLFLYNKRPSILFFGDFGDDGKIYAAQFK